MPHNFYMRTFDCVTYVKMLYQRRTKLDANGVKCLFSLILLRHEDVLAHLFGNKENHQ